MSRFQRQRSLHDEADAAEVSDKEEHVLSDVEAEGMEDDDQANSHYAMRQEEQRDAEYRPPDTIPYTFCPSCGNLLLLENQPLEFSCATCSFKRPIHYALQHSRYYVAKETVGIVSEKEKNKNRQRTAYVCPKCEHPEAYFFMLQTRSADEPMTTFYTCANDKCALKTRE